MQGSTFRKRRHGKCRVVPSREKEAWQMQGTRFQQKGGMVNAG